MPGATLIVLVAYLIGSISFAVMVSRAMGLPDPHTYGSGNPGATNVLRTGSRKAAALTLLGDTLKGVIAVVFAQWAIGPAQAPAGVVALAALAVFVGHLFPVFFGFRGGKGVATAAGILFALDWRLGAVTLGIWIMVAVATRFSSLAAITAAIAAPLGAWLLMDRVFDAACVLAIALLLVMRHAANIRKLLAGTESRLQFKR